MATVVRSNCMRQMATAGATPAARAPVVSRVTGAAMRTPGETSRQLCYAIFSVLTARIVDMLCEFCVHDARNSPDCNNAVLQASASGWTPSMQAGSDP